MPTLAVWDACCNQCKFLAAHPCRAPSLVASPAVASLAVASPAAASPAVASPAAASLVVPSPALSVCRAGASGAVTAPAFRA